MINFTPINPALHSKLKIITLRADEFGDNVQTAPVLLCELDQLIKEFPIVFMKDSESGRFGLHALLGLKHKENLFLDPQNKCWAGNYIPLHLTRQPFMLGIQALEESTNLTTMGFDINSARISKTHGEALFQPDGSESNFLLQMRTTLNKIRLSTPTTKHFVDTLVKCELIEHAHIKITLSDETTLTLEGLYTLNAEALSQLTPPQQAYLTSNNFLKPLQNIHSSVNNINGLIERKNINLSKDHAE